MKDKKPYEYISALQRGTFMQKLWEFVKTFGRNRDRDRHIDAQSTIIETFIRSVN